MKRTIYPFATLLALPLTLCFFSGAASAETITDTAAFRKYIRQVPYVQLVPLYNHLVKVPLEKKEVKPITLYPYAKMIVLRLESFRNQKPAEAASLSDAKWTEEFNLRLSRDILITHIGLLNKLFKDQEACVYAAFAEDYLHYTVAVVNNAYALCLDEQGNQKRLREVLLASIYENQVTPEMVGILGRLYLAGQNPESGFSDYLQSLKNHSRKGLLQGDTISTKQTGAAATPAANPQNGKAISPYPFWKSGTFNLRLWL